MLLIVGTHVVSGAIFFEVRNYLKKWCTVAAALCWIILHICVAVEILNPSILNSSQVTLEIITRILDFFVHFRKNSASKKLK